MSKNITVIEGGENFIICLSDSQLDILKNSEIPLSLTSSFDDKFEILLKDKVIYFIINGIEHVTSYMDLDRLSYRFYDWVTDNALDLDTDTLAEYRSKYKTKEDFVYALQSCGLYSELFLMKFSHS